ncbi:sulfurtransferase TusA family protein [Moorella sulfitireducens]|uniref:sulfurtransferase TusA family protein n=1 Tax=Neomoorella sulfitireducens TaxID=2972948 RepID=UPI0021AC9D83|nr:sulfurtransferase TusA family protein [Moorella sulfitireducens]
MAVYRLDTCGEMCPIPIVRTKVKLKELKPGDMLIVTSDHSCTSQSLAETVQKMGYRVEVMGVSHGIWEVIIEKV